MEGHLRCSLHPGRLNRGIRKPAWSPQWGHDCLVTSPTCSPEGDLPVHPIRGPSCCCSPMDSHAILESSLLP